MNNHDDERDGSSSDEDDVLVDESSEDDDNDNDGVKISPKKGRKSKATAGALAPIVVHSSFDAYFTHTAARPQTSNNVFSSIIPPLTAEEYNEAIKGLDDERKQPLKSEIISNPAIRNALFSRLVLQLRANFNIICYGYGSKRQILNQFAVERCAKLGHVVVVNGFHPEFGGVKEVVKAVENNVSAISSLPLPSASTTLDSQIQRIREYFSGDSSTKKKQKPRHLYLIIHNIDSATLRTSKSQSMLSNLAASPGVHIVASIDHINAPLIWSSSQLSSRGSDSATGSSSSSSSSMFSKGFNWLWTDMTTLAPYDFELTFADRTSLSGAHDITSRRHANALANSLTNAAISETAALHVLASVTVKAKALFREMGKKQLAAMVEAGEQGVGAGAATDGNYWHQFAVTYPALLEVAKAGFWAVNDTALRALLGEFKDHNLIVGSQGGSEGELLWIPARRDRLEKILDKLKE
ncbi:Origin recognition complex subunit 2 [Marasmius tenuissimus]|uniref:Origin recognition complex subunit 2 n=1 Tax=Marasmius tenuissimus TaxID=585030 RepID=A0ABR2ZFL8_9AGAR